MVLLPGLVFKTVSVEYIKEIDSIDMTQFPLTGMMAG